MPGTDDILTEVYGALAGNAAITVLCTVFKGRKRPKNTANPSLTVDLGRLERGEGEGIWMADLTVTVYADLLSGRTPDHETHDTIGKALRKALDGFEPVITGAKAMPLIEGACGGVDWDAVHDGETRQEHLYGLVFVKFS